MFAYLYVKKAKIKEIKEYRRKILHFQQPSTGEKT